METLDLKNMITVYSEATPNPETMKFVLNRLLLPNDTADFPDVDSASDSPLASELFNTFDYVRGVFVMNNFVTVTKSEATDWYDIIPTMKEFIKTYVEQDKPIINARTPGLSDDEDDEVVKKIKELLDTHVKPAVEMDGGAITFKSFDQGVVTLSLKGSCSGCPSSTVTLKAGIEGLLKRMVPEVSEVIADAD
ncbi:MAG: NifU family protein [Bacteroidetes bacterium]|nr:NifU family protein [Bacteroidota bacterium]